jgi:hypothetical protein
MLTRYTILQTVLTIVMLSLNFYGLNESLENNSWMGFVCSIASLVALVFCLQIIRQLKRVSAEPESETLN